MFSNTAGKPKADQPFYNWGSSVGGPVVAPKIYNGRNKTFFYLTTESYRQKSPLTDQYDLPTAAEKSGDFSQSARTIYDPLTSHPCTAEVCYIGSRSKHLQTSSTAAGGYDINQVPDH